MGVQQLLQSGGIHHRKPGDVPAFGQCFGIQPLFPGQQQKQRPGAVAVLEDEVFQPRHPQGPVHLLRFGGGFGLAGKLHPLIGDAQLFQQGVALPFPVAEMVPGRPL